MKITNTRQDRITIVLALLAIPLGFFVIFGCFWFIFNTLGFRYRINIPSSSLDDVFIYGLYTYYVLYILWWLKRFITNKLPFIKFDE